METNGRYIDKLAKFILIAAIICIIGTICWYFKINSMHKQQHEILRLLKELKAKEK